MSRLETTTSKGVALRVDRDDHNDGAELWRLDCGPPAEDFCVIRVDGVELVRGPVEWTHDLFEHITSQPGASGYDLPGIEKLIGRPFTPAPNQKVEYVSAIGGLLISGSVPEPDPSQTECYWPLPSI